MRSILPLGKRSTVSSGRLRPAMRSPDRQGSRLA